MNRDSELHPDTISKKLSALSDAEFLDLGNNGLSYIKATALSGGDLVYALHGADGSHIATGQDMQTIQNIAAKHQLIPMTIQ